ncbi:MAG: PDZ domain-containing protein, partial [Flavobacteriales bacterium]|nr:PDZ domain-containing protein [Flavobacteriales bacterium]
DGGLNVNDEIIAIDGFRVTDNLSDFIDSKNVGDKISITISRDNILQTIDIVLKERGNTYYQIYKATKDINSVYKKWLEKI